MLTGPYEWKPGLLGRRVRVEFSEESLTVTSGSTHTVIPYTEIRSVYFYGQPQIFLMRSIMLQVVSLSGEKTTISGSRAAFIMNEQFVIAKKAIAAFFAWYHQAIPNVEVVLGFPRSVSMAMLWGGLTAGMLGYVFYAMWHDGMMATQLEFFTFCGFALLMSLMMTWQFYRNTGSKRKPARDLYEQLRN